MIFDNIIQYEDSGIADQSFYDFQILSILTFLPIDEDKIRFFW